MSDLISGLSSNPSTYQGANGTTDKNKTEKSNETNNATKTKNGMLVEEENKGVKVQDFLNLMIAQLKNQDFMNPMDDTQYVTQLAQFSTMQQMQELAYNSKANFMSSLVGKEVTAAKLSLGGDVSKTTGVVNKLSLVDGKFNFYIEGSDKAFTFEQIMEINNPKKTEDKPSDDKDNGDDQNDNSNSDSKTEE